MALEVSKRHALVIGNSQYTAERRCRGLSLPQLEAAPLGPYYDACFMEKELGRRGFEVAHHFNVGAAAIRTAVEEFVEGVTSRKSAGCGGHETLLLYFSGHGIQEGLGAERPLAVGVDGEPLDLFSTFVAAVDGVDRAATNSIILLMDACLHHVGMAADPNVASSGSVASSGDERAATAPQPRPAQLMSLLDRLGKDQSTESNNLQVCAHTYMRDASASGKAASGAWTRAVVRSMEQDDSDLVRLLQRAAADRYLQGKDTQGLVWASRPGAHSTCSLEAPMHLRMQSFPTESTLLSSLPDSEACVHDIESLSAHLEDVVVSDSSGPAPTEHLLHTIMNMLQLLGHDTDVILMGRLRLQACSPEKPARFKGRQSVVQLAYCPDSGREVALKIYACRNSFEAEKKFYRQWEGIRPQLSDNSFLRCHKVLEASEEDAGGTGGLPMPPCMVMERAESLEMCMRRSWPDRMAALNVIRNVAQRLSSVHEAGLVHRDLKRADVMWLPRAHCWTVIDFSCMVEGSSIVEPVVTLPYAAPEVLQAVAEGRLMVADASLDCWALGVLAYEMLTGKLWVPAASSAEHVIGCVLERNGQCLPSALSLHSEGIMSLYGCMHTPLASLLNKDVSKRSTCHDVLAAFDNMLAAHYNLLPAHGFGASQCLLRRHALVIGNSGYTCGSLHRLRAPEHDALRVQQELKARGFNVTLEMDLSQAGLRRALSILVESFKRRQHCSAAAAEMLVVYYSGHGALSTSKQSPCAMGIDGGRVNLQHAFLGAADKVAEGASNAFILLADACLTFPLASQHGNAQRESRVTHKGMVGDEDSAPQMAPKSCFPNAGTPPAHKGNLIIAAHAAQPGQFAVQADRMMYSMWTSCFLQALLAEDSRGSDIMRILAHTALLMSQEGCCKSQYSLFTPGKLSTVSVARQDTTQVEEEDTCEGCPLRPFMPLMASDLAHGAYVPC